MSPQTDPGTQGTACERSVSILSFSYFKLAEPEITGVKALSCLGVVDVERKS